MLWVIFALITPLLWSANSVVNKFMLEKITKNVSSFYILSTFLQTIIVLFLVLFFRPVFDFNLFILSIISGILGSSAFLAMLHALEKDDASKVVPLTYLSNIFIIVLAFIFLNESFPISKYFGIALLLSGAFILSYKKTKNKFHFSPALLFILVNSILFASQTILNKFILSSLDFWSMFIWGMIGANMVVVTLLFKKNVRKDFLTNLKIKKRHYLIVLLNVCFGMGGLLSYFVALSLGPATLVSSVGAVTPLFTLILTVFFSIFFPHILQEDISRKNLANKIFCIVLIVVGAVITVL